MAELKFAAHLHHASPAGRRDVEWEIPVLATEAQNDVGIAELLAEIRRHRAVLEQSGALAARRQARRRAELETLLMEELRERMRRELRGGALAQTFDEVAAGVLDPYTATETILAMLSLRPS